MLGVVLAGGLARRMGGGDKGLREVGGRAILARAVACLRPQCAALVLSANGDPARFAPFGLPVVPDDLPDRPGPLAGLLAALDWAALHRPDLPLVATAAGDQPFLPADLVARLGAAREEGAAVGAPALIPALIPAVAASGGRIHPTNALVPVALRADLRRALVAEGLRGAGAWLARAGAVRVAWPDAPLDPFHSVNAPEDLAEARRLAEAECPAGTEGPGGARGP